MKKLSEVLLNGDSSTYLILMGALVMATLVVSCALVRQ